jgi:hypothetical protein
MAISRDTVGSEAVGPNTCSWARTTAMSARQSPPSATAVARSSSTLPGSWIARSARHGASAADSVLSNPETRFVCRNNNPPAEDTSDSRAGSRTRPGTGLPFTYGVPFRSDDDDFSNRQSSKQDRHFRAYRAAPPRDS